MATRRTLISDGLFWGLMAALMAGVMGGAIGFVFSEFYGAGWISGAALGAVVFLVAAVILGQAAGSVNLPPPNTLRAPVAPPGGAFRAPDGGKFQAPAGASAPLRVAEPAPAPVAEPEPAPVVEPVAEGVPAMAEAAGKAVYTASAAVTTAAEAARAAIADILAPSGAPVTDVVATAPAMLEGPRGGVADDLKRIKGIGPKFEELLNGRGIYHFDQIASWGPAEVAWVDAQFEGFSGRAMRDDWIGQARLLAGGGATEFSERVDKGDVY